MRKMLMAVALVACSAATAEAQEGARFCAIGQPPEQLGQNYYRYSFALARVGEHALRDVLANERGQHDHDPTVDVEDILLYHSSAAGGQRFMDGVEIRADEVLVEVDLHTQEPLGSDTHIYYSANPRTSDGRSYGIRILYACSSGETVTIAESGVVGW